MGIHFHGPHTITGPVAGGDQRINGRLVTPGLGMQTHCSSCTDRIGPNERHIGHQGQYCSGDCYRRGEAET